MSSTACDERQPQQLATELSRVQENVHRRLSSELSSVRESFHRELSYELSRAHECFQQYQEVLAQVPAMKEHLQHIESFTIEELHRVKTMLEQQTQGMQRSSTPAPSSPRAWKRTPISSFQRSNNVHVQQARNFHSQRQSRYRKQFVASLESSTVVDNESSIMKAESTDVSSVTDVRRAVGEEEASPLPFSRM